MIATRTDENGHRTINVVEVKANNSRLWKLQKFGAEDYLGDRLMAAQYSEMKDATGKYVVPEWSPENDASEVWLKDESARRRIAAPEISKIVSGWNKTKWINGAPVIDETARRTEAAGADTTKIGSLEWRDVGPKAGTAKASTKSWVNRAEATSTQSAGRAHFNAKPAPRGRGPKAPDKERG